MVIYVWWMMLYFCFSDKLIWKNSAHPIVTHSKYVGYLKTYIDGLVQERRNSSALAMELRLSSTYPWQSLPWTDT